MCLCLAATVLVCFSGVLRNGFTGYDDPDYVTANPHVNTGLTAANFRWALTASHAGNWHPLTWLSHALDCALFGLNPAGHHFTSLLLHALNTVLLFLWLDGLAGLRWRAAFVALGFGLHPLHVESVAWVAERKDVLSGFFWLLALLAYTAYARRPALGRYMIVAAFLAAGLTAKPMVVTLPVLLILIDWWTGRSPRLLEKLPLFALAAAASAIAVVTHTEASASLEALPLNMRLSTAAVSYLAYLWKMVWPVNLAVFYPMRETFAPWAIAACLLIALAGVRAALSKWDGPSPFVVRPVAARAFAFACGWYAVTLLPVIGIVQTGMQAMADRYMYIPMIGPLIAIAWAAPPRRASVVAAVAALAACAVLTWRLIPVWHDGVTLFTHAIGVTDRNFVAHDNLGVELDRRGRSEEALAHYREAVRIRPGDRNAEFNFAQAMFSKGEKLFLQGRLDDALKTFREGLPHMPRSAVAHTYSGLVLLQQDQIAPAIAELRLATAADPNFVRAHVGLGVALAHSGDFDGARQSLQRALQLEPANAEARFDLDLIDRNAPRK